MTRRASTLTALELLVLVGPGVALSQFAPFQYLQEPGRGVTDGT
jgi:hypothetical protein